MPLGSGVGTALDPELDEDDRVLCQYNKILDAFTNTFVEGGDRYITADLAMQGRDERWPQKVQAYMQHQVKVKRNEVLRFKDGVLTSEGGRCTVRLAGRFESSNCYILLQPGEVYYPEGELVDVLLATPFQ